MRKTAGFTLLEMLVTMAVLAILLATAVPAWQTLVQDTRLKTVRDGLIMGLNQARLHALSRNVNATLCPYTASGSCGNDWTQGWQLLEQTASGTALVKAAPAGGGAAPSIAVPAGMASGITFSPRPPFVAAAQAGDFVLCDARGASAAQALTVQTTGFVQAGPGGGLAMDGKTALSCPLPN